MISKHCEWCDHSFETEVKYQIYCSAECREQATKEKILARYIAKKRQKRSQKLRVCKSCGTALSMYNDESICHKCKVNPDEVSKALKQIKGIANGKDLL